MARTKNLVDAQAKMTTKLRITVQRRQSKEEDSDSKEDVTKSDSESQPSPLTTKQTPRPATKQKATESVPALSGPASPLVTSSPATTPQPEPSSKRKGGNKRKFTHEYCLTCTRYGRACGGRRENEDGCAVCRDPDRSKGEKLRECLWADPENGIDDYKTARELFKKAQAEARALRAKPQNVKRQRSDAALSHPTALHSHNTASGTSLPTGPLPQTSKPLNLLPPARSESGHASQEARYAQMYGINPENAEDPQSALQSPIADATHDQAPRIHRPQLSYIRIGSDNGEYTASTSQSARLILPLQFQMNGSSPSGPYYWDPAFQAWQRAQIPMLSQRAAPYYTHPYRSAYDAPPAPPPYLRRPSHQFMDPPSGAFNPRISGSPPSLPLDKSGTPPRKWSTSSRKITSIDGAEWRAKTWQPTDEVSKAEASEVAAGKKESGTTRADDTSDTSSLSTCLSMGGEMSDDATDTGTANNGTKLRLRLGNGGNSKKPNTFTFPGEITIEDDDEDGVSSSDDAELSSDESKHKTLPAKLRKILSRSRVTKVIIEGDVFEIRPRSMIQSSKIQKKAFTTSGTFRNGPRNKSHKQNRRRISQLPSAESEDETEEQEHDGILAAQSQTGDSSSKPTPIKIKLIFNRKSATVSNEKAQDKRESDAAEQVAGNLLTPVDDDEMDESWQRTP